MQRIAVPMLRAQIRRPKAALKAEDARHDVCDTCATSRHKKRRGHRIVVEERFENVAKIIGDRVVEMFESVKAVFSLFDVYAAAAVLLLLFDGVDAGGVDETKLETEARAQRRRHHRNRQRAVAIILLFGDAELVEKRDAACFGRVERRRGCVERFWAPIRGCERKMRGDRLQYKKSCHANNLHLLFLGYLPQALSEYSLLDILFRLRLCTFECGAASCRLKTILPSLFRIEEYRA